MQLTALVLAATCASIVSGQIHARWINPEHENFLETREIYLEAREAYLESALQGRELDENGCMPGYKPVGNMCRGRMMSKEEAKATAPERRKKWEEEKAKDAERAKKLEKIREAGKKNGGKPKPK